MNDKELEQEAREVAVQVSGYKEGSKYNDTKAGALEMGKRMQATIAEQKAEIDKALQIIESDITMLGYTPSFHRELQQALSE